VELRHASSRSALIGALAFDATVVVSMPSHFHREEGRASMNISRMHLPDPAAKH
jgi:hypothetical protein